MKRFISFMLVFVLASAFLVGCSQQNNKKEEITSEKIDTTVSENKKEESSKKEETSQKEETSIQNEKKTSDQAVRIENMGETSEFTKVPEKVFCNEINLTQTLLALGLESKIVAIAGGEFNPEDALPEYRDAMKKFQYAGDYLSLEAVIATGCDFIYSNPTSYSDRYTLKDFNENNIDVYACRTNYVKNATVEDVFEDIGNLGKIFRVDDKAEELIKTLRKRQTEVMSKIDQKAEPVKVLVYDSGEDGVLTPGAGLVSDIVKSAGGHNIFSDVEKAWSKVSWEEVVARNPEVILVNVYPRNSQTFEEKVQLIKSNPVLKDVAAVKNNRFVELPMIETFSGIQIFDGIERIHKGLLTHAD